MSARAVGIVYEFGDFALDAGRRLLTSRLDGTPIPLPAAAVHTLVYLIERAGELVDKDSLLRTVWPHVNVVENNLVQSISALRRALGDLSSDHRFIATVPGRGYHLLRKSLQRRLHAVNVQLLFYRSNRLVTALDMTRCSLG
ncbi:MAG TPA: transcriptional regulator [Terriglobia bacterium]|nr:transcriptional regulator [Terriglobia bacterium]